VTGVEDPVWPDAREPKPPRPVASKVRIVALGSVLLAVSAFGYGAWRAHQPKQLTFCEGIGLFGPPAASPRGALDAFFVAAHGKPSDPDVWHEVDGEDKTSANFVNEHYGGRLEDYQSIQVQRGAPVAGSTLAAGEWSVQGACL
jgi:hypothetical protein